MDTSITFTRVVFGLLGFVFMITYTISHSTYPPLMQLFIGLGLGAILALVLVLLDNMVRRFDLRSFNNVIIGLFLGYLMGKGLVTIFDAATELGSFAVGLNQATLDIMRISLLLIGTYLGTLLTIAFSEKFYISIPFVQLSQSTLKKDILIDHHILLDQRLIDLCHSGILNDMIIVPQFAVKFFTSQLECSEEVVKARARKALDILSKLEGINGLGLRYNELDFPEIKDINRKMLKLADNLEANILSAEPGKIYPFEAGGIKFIDLHSLSNALKPLIPTGETINIKVQRYGKEPKQGVGYLEDGTMVVINNGGDFIGETLDTQVISIKQTSAGRIIFTNALTENMDFISPGYCQQESSELQHEYN